MSKKAELTAAEYLLLHEKIIQKFREYCEQKGLEVSTKKFQLYGMNNYELNEPNLQNHIATNIAFKSYCDEHKIKIHSNIGKYIYQRRKAADKGNNIKISGEIYTEALFKYIGYNDVHDFLKQYGDENLKVEDSNIKEGGLKGVTEYLGFVCTTHISNTEITKNITEFQLWVDYENTISEKTNENKQYFPVKMKVIKKPYEGLLYTGEAKLYMGTLRIILKSSKDRDIVFSFSTGFGQIKKREVLRGMYIGTSEDNDETISSEAILIKKEKATNEAITHITQYLQSNHYQIRVPRTHTFRRIENPKDKGTLKIKDIIGEYWSINAAYQGKLYLAKLVIKPNLESYLESKLGDEIFIIPCSITLKNNLLFLSKDDVLKSKRKLIGYDILMRFSLERGLCFIGTDVYVGFRQVPEQTRKFLIRKESDFPEKEIGYLDEGTIRFLIQKDPRLGECFTYLLKMTEEDKKREQEIEQQRQLYKALITSI